jgi:cell wall-associated NlpC family hydrolase
MSAVRTIVSSLARPAGWARVGALALLVLLVLPAIATAADASSPPPSRWVKVSVATLWVTPDAARAVDRASLSDPADPRAWIAAMTVAQKRWLVGRLETQALYGQKVYLVKTSGSWSKVAVAGQPTPRNAWGYPGWLPTSQLTAQPPPVTPHVAIVKNPKAWLWRNADLTGAETQLSYGTRLPVTSWGQDSIETLTLDGRTLYLRRGAATVRVRGKAWPTLTGAALVREARRFAGLQYLWAGTSGFGFDCSGFTYAVHRQLGKTIPRDAGPQATKGRKVPSRSALKAGDLVFFRNAAGKLNHVGMYVGGGRMIHAPRTGRPVATVSIWTEPYRSTYAGGRRHAL